MSKEKQNIFGNLIRVPVFLLVFLMPVLFSSRFVYDAFGIPKITVLRFFAPLIFFFWALKKIVSREAVKISAITYFATAFVFAAGIATVFSKDSFVSFFGLCPYYEWGFTGVFACFLLFLVVSDEFETDDWTAVGMVVLIASAIVSVYGIAQMLGFDPFYKATYSFNRIFSTLGNPNFLGGYLVMVIPIALAFYLGSPTKYIPYVFVLNFFLVINLGITLSRASWLAFGVSAVLFVLISGAENRRRGGKRLLVLFVSFMVIFFVFLANRKGLESLQQPASKSLVSQRAGVLITSGEASASARLETWKSAIEMFKDNFWHGVGPNLFQYIFPKYMTLKFARLTSGKSVSNYAHNTILQVASTMGIFALAAYITLWLGVLFFGLKRVLNTFGGERFYFAGVVSSFFALFIFLQFHFFLSETMVYFWIFLGFFSSVNSNKNISLNRGLRILFFVSALIFIGFYWIFSTRNLMADSYLLRGEAVKAHKLVPRSVLYSRRAVGEIKNEALKKKSIELLYCARDIAKKNAGHHPDNPRIWNDLGAINMDFLKFNRAEYLNEAGEAFRRSYELGPFLFKHVLDLSKYYEFIGEKNCAEEYSEESKIIKGGSGNDEQ